MNRARRVWIAATASLLFGAGTAFVARGAGARVIRLRSRKFVFSPSVVRLKKGQPVVFEFLAEDVPMSFYAPDLGLRSLMLPDKVLTLDFVPQSTGSFAFLCGVFCGEGHERMSA